MNEEPTIIKQTRCWVKSVIVEHNFCPFARRELERDSIRYSINHDTDLEPALQAVIDECVYLNE
ncbi:MAG: DUF1415 domain-containing protein, partial [Gammaproteobacteria bacterium]|nr:DUF1415 domain-containing protein [Gammaproteobacteria bacterium]